MLLVMFHTWFTDKLFLFHGNLLTDHPLKSYCAYLNVFRWKEQILVSTVIFFQMLIEYTGEGAQCQAAKLLEVIVLQYRGHLDQVSQLNRWNISS